MGVFVCVCCQTIVWPNMALWFLAWLKWRFLILNWKNCFLHNCEIVLISQTRVCVCVHALIAVSKISKIHTDKGVSRQSSCSWLSKLFPSLIDSSCPVVNGRECIGGHLCERQPCLSAHLMVRPLYTSYTSYTISTRKVKHFLCSASNFKGGLLESSIFCP